MAGYGHAQFGYLRRCLAASPEHSSHVRKAYAYLVNCFEQLNRASEAWDTCEQGLRLFPLDAELRFRKASLLQDRGRLKEAIDVYRDVLERSEEPHFASVNPGIQGHLARHNLAVAYTDLGDLPKAEEQWRWIVANCPKYRPGWAGLADVLRAQGRKDEADKVQRQRNPA